MTDKRSENLIVGLSGGVDSSVAAALMVRAGHQVRGVFMRNWTGGGTDSNCGWRREREDAAAVADKLGIPFETWDFEREYRDGVFDYMLREYAAGRTPNPDVLCNDRVKFGPFLQRARAEGADTVVTGHYARTEIGPDGAVRLLAGRDDNKDQSYFLHRLNQEQLSQARFPVGELTKPEVRKIARELGLPTADKKDSVGLCFVGDVDFRSFLTERLPAGKPGPIVTVDGRVIGRHAGLSPYTIGQRHGLGLTDGQLYFVVEKDPAKNTLVVAAGEDPAELYSSSLVAEDLRWVSGQESEMPLLCRARIRYRQPLQDCVVSAGTETGQVEVKFDEPQRAVAPGQFVVFQDGERCLGGGRIVRAVSGS